MQALRWHGAGDVRLHRVHVVLDDGEQVGIQRVQLGEQRLHGGHPGRRLHHRAQLDSVREGQPVLTGAPGHRRVHLLEVHVTDPVGESADDLDVVALAVGDVAGVET